MSELCRHCRTRKVNRSRGLCWTCYYTPGVCDLYPSSATTLTCTRCRSTLRVCRKTHLCVPCRKGSVIPQRIAEMIAALPTADVGPTDAPPWHGRKIAVLMARAAAGVDLWQKGDATGLEEGKG